MQCSSGSTPDCGARHSRIEYKSGSCVYHDSLQHSDIEPLGTPSLQHRKHYWIIFITVSPILYHFSAWCGLKFAFLIPPVFITPSISRTMMSEYCHIYDEVTISWRISLDDMWAVLIWPQVWQWTDRNHRITSMHTNVAYTVLLSNNYKHFLFRLTQLHREQA